VICPNCGFEAPMRVIACPRCGMPMGTEAEPTHPVGTLGRATAVLLGLAGLASLAVAVEQLAGDAVRPVFGLLAAVAVLVSGIVFLVWFYRIRYNSETWGPQRRSQLWAILGWFVPVVFFWFPYQIADDAWQASTDRGPARERNRRITLAWWVCWALAWVTSFRSTNGTAVNATGTTVHSSNVSFFLGSTALSSAFTAIAAALAIVVVLRLSAAQEARRTAETMRASA
jgi:Domain of unknown function (DUF4328)